MESVPAQLRGSNLRTACDLCRLRKIRCDRAQPACENCRIAGHRCIFTPPAPLERRNFRKELITAEARIQQLETELVAARSHASQNASRVSVPSPQGSLGSFQSQAPIPPGGYIFDTRSMETSVTTFRGHIRYCGLGAPLSNTRADFCSAIYQRTGHKFDLEQFLHETARSFEIQGFRSSNREILPEWPPLDLVQNSIEYYTRSGLYSIFPFADADELHLLLNSQQQGRPAPIRAADRACLAAFTANVTQMHRHLPEFTAASPDAYAQAAFTLMPEIMSEQPDVRTLEAIMMLIIFIAPLGQAQSMDFLLGIAIQVLYDLGGHRIQPRLEITGRPSQNNHLRALFWLCYGTDSEQSIRKGRPPLLNETHCDLDLPINYAVKSKEQHFYWRPLSSDELLYPSDLRLNIIKTRIYNFLYSEKNGPQTEAGRVQLIRELDHELSDLRAEFPVQCRPEVFANEATPKYELHDLSIRGVSIHLEYFYCLGKIHGSNDPYNISLLNAHSPLPSSAEITYEAARSTLIYINMVQHYINYHTFWIHAHFVLTAVVTLFRFLIMRPSTPSFFRDLQILEETAQMFAGFTISDDPERNCVASFYITHAFIKQLIYLAQESRARSGS